MADNLQNIGNNVPVDALAQRWQKPDQYQGITLVLNSANFQRGKRGNFYLMNCTVENTNETILISCGASQPMMVIEAWKANGERPVRFTFQIEGSRILIVNPNEENPSVPF